MSKGFMMQSKSSFYLKSAAALSLLANGVLYFLFVWRAKSVADAAVQADKRQVRSVNTQTVTVEDDTFDHVDIDEAIQPPDPPSSPANPSDPTTASSPTACPSHPDRDRKSTRLNSSHSQI